MTGAELDEALASVSGFVGAMSPNESHSVWDALDALHEAAARLRELEADHAALVAQCGEIVKERNKAVALAGAVAHLVFEWDAYDDGDDTRVHDAAVALRTALAAFKEGR